MRKASTNALPERLRPYANDWQNDVNRILGGFVRGQAILALVLGASAALACGALGLRFWLLIGVFVTIASLIPVVGPYIGALPAIVSAMLTQTGLLHNLPGVRVALVILVFFVINEAGSKVLYPRLVGRALGLHEVLVLFALLAGFEIGGITGVLFAAPLTALASVTVAQLWRLWTHAPPVSVSDEAAIGGKKSRSRRGSVNTKKPPDSAGRLFHRLRQTPTDFGRRRGHPAGLATRAGCCRRRIRRRC